LLGMTLDYVPPRHETVALATTSSTSPRAADIGLQALRLIPVAAGA